MSERIDQRPWFVLLGAMLLAVLAVVNTAHVRGQEEPAAAAAESEQPAETKKAPKKPRGRLPMYYSKVVTSAQREEIYSIQSQYQEQIDALMKQVQELEAKRDAEVAAVLTPEQQKQVAEMMEDLRKRRSTLRNAGRDSEAEGAGASNEQADEASS